MLVAGAGSELWHVRVDLIAASVRTGVVDEVAGALRSRLHGEHAGPGLGAGVDQGKGVEGQPVVGLTFWVQADDVGAAALTALETAREAGSVAGVGPDYYDVTLVPRAAVVVPEAEHSIEMAT